MPYRIGSKEITFDNRNLVGYGKNGNVYKYRKDAIKVFPNGDVPSTLLDVDTCSKLCDISTNCILLPKNIVYYNNNFSGYTLKLVKRGNNKSIINMDKDDLVSNVKGIERDVELLSKKGVLLDGILPENVIISDKIYITDPSKYIIIDSDKNSLSSFNSYQIHLLLSNLVLSSLKKTDIKPNELRKLKRLLLSKKENLKSSDFFNYLIDKDNNIKEYVKKTR